MRWIERYPRATLAVVALLASLHPLLQGFPRGNDHRPHVVWSSHFSNQLFGGELYPRWLLEIGGGFGGPVFFFYPPLPYYVTSFFQLLWPEPEQIHVRLGMAVVLAIFAAAFACFAWLRLHVRPAAAVFGAAVYTLLPYHLMVDLTIRVAFAEVWAFVWPPLLLLAVDEALRRPVRGLLLGAAATAGLIVTHPPTALTATPLALAYGAFESVRLRSVLPVGLAFAFVGFGAALAGGYAATALGHGAFVQQEHLYGTYFAATRWLLWGEGIAGIQPQFALLLERGAVAMAALAVGCGIAVRRSPLALFAALAAVVYFALMLPISAVFWEHVPLLPRIQFPWRMSLELTLFAAAGLAAVAHGTLGGARARAAAWIAALCVLALLGANHFASGYRALGHKKALVLLRRNTTQGEHVVPRERDPIALFEADERVAWLAGSGEAEVEAWEPRHLRLQVRTPGPARLAVRQQSYPGWSVRVGDGAPQPPLPAIAAEYGILAVELPAGEHTVDLTLGATPWERAGWITSAVALPLLLGSAAFWERRRRRAASG